MRQLGIYVNNRKAGVLTELHPGSAYSFQYDQNYLVSDTPSISVTLPKSSSYYESTSLFPFFANMLPEGVNRRVICRANRLDENDLFGLLAVMSDSDFIGGVHIKTEV